MISWLAGHDRKIAFDQYAGDSEIKRRTRLSHLRVFRDKFAGKEYLITALRAALTDDVMTIRTLL